MKKWVWILVVMMTLSLASAAVAGTIVNEPDRKIKVSKSVISKKGAVVANPVIEGESPTTGLPWTGRYQPMLVQIDNSTGGVDKVKHWGIRDADVVYETLLHANGTTRISALFSDKMPESVGPIRSARVAHAWLRQEWQAGFCFYGCQKKAKTSVPDEFKKLGVKSDMMVLLDGSAGKTKPWKKYYNAVPKLARPHHVEANVAAMQELIDPSVYAATPRPFLFTDDKPTTGDYAEFIWIENPKKVSVSPSYTYNYDENVYYRYVGGQPYYDKDIGPEEGHQAFANVIVQRCETSFKNGLECPLTPVALHKGVAQGNAEIFTGGRYIAGYWVRQSMNDRTVFLDAEGNEIELQRGRTFIQIVNNDFKVTYSCEPDMMDQLLQDAQATIEKERAAGVDDSEDGDDFGTDFDADDDDDESGAGAKQNDEDEEDAGEKSSGASEAHPIGGKTTVILKVRKTPDVDGKVMGSLKKGSKVQVIGEEGDWFIIRYQKKQGYVLKQYVKVAD